MKDYTKSNELLERELKVSPLAATSSLTICARSVRLLWATTSLP